MARAFTFDEVDDPDLQWMISEFLYHKPDYILVECIGLPYFLLPARGIEASEEVFKNLAGAALTIGWGTGDANNGWVSRSYKKRG